MIAAMAKNRVIGQNNALPWHLPADLKHFKNLTLGKPIVMGRKTYESIGKPLPGRTNIILTQQANYTAPGCQVLQTKAQVLNLAAQYEEVMVIGGAMLYQLFLPYATKLYLTLVDTELDGDAYFPTWKPKEWQETARIEHEIDSQHAYRYAFVTLVKTIT